MDPKYQFYLATSRGTIICTCCTLKEKIQYDKSEEPSEVTSLIFGRTENEIVAGYRNGTVAFFNTEVNKFDNKKIKNIEGDGAVTGLGCVENTIVIARCDGIINLWKNKKDKDFFSINLDEKGTLDCMVSNKSRKNVIGTGGQFNDMKLWDIETKQCIFKAKSLGHDELNLPIPTSIRGISFFEEESLSACATREGHVLLYDERAQRKPVVKFLEKKASYTTISPAYRERQCVVGTTRGYMQHLDLKTNKCLRTFTSFTGSVTSIECDPMDSVVAATSLDRHLRIFNLETKELLHKVYLKQNLTKLLMRPIVKAEPELEESNKDSKEVIDEEYEDLFNNMETIDDHKKTKRKNFEKQNSAKKKKIKQNIG